MSQLDLFEGVILTQDQEKKVESFIENQKTRSKRLLGENNNIQNALIEAGFIEGIDFENTFEVKTFTHDVTLGYSYDDSQFTTNITHVDTKGCITLFSKTYNKSLDKVVDRSINYLSFENGKFECSSLTGNYRKIKPTTLLAKLRLQRERAEEKMKNARNTDNAFAIAMDELKTKFPLADILRTVDYNRYGGRYHESNIIKAQFENGSYVTFNVHSDGSYRVGKKYDANIRAMGSNEVMEFFTNQNK